MKKAPLHFRKAHIVFWIVLTLVIMFNHTFSPASGAVYDFMEIHASVACASPVVILQNGTDNVSFVYTNNTSAKIAVNATTEPQTYNYTLNIVNNSSNNYQVKLEIDGNPNVSRISYVTIGFYDDSTFYNQITINAGVITESSGTYIDLNAFSTFHIKIEDLQESESGDTYVYVFLWIKEINSSIYTRYTILFEFT